VTSAIEYEGDLGLGGAEGLKLWRGEGASTSCVHVAPSAANRGAYYCAAFVIDPDGDNIEAVCRKPA
jgi:hypothetical protein